MIIKRSCKDCEYFSRPINDSDYCKNCIRLDGLKRNFKEKGIKTRQSEFLKMFPNAPLNSNGYLIITPCALNKELYNKSCEICKYKGYSASCDKAKYWNEEVK